MSVSGVSELPIVDPPSAGFRWVRELIHGRQNFTPKRLVDPGPSPDQLKGLLEAAAAAPDHGELTPWRFIRIAEGGRQRLGEIFRDALLERDGNATAQQQLDAQAKARRAPCLLLAVVDLGPRERPIPDAERLISLGCAIQNMLLQARAFGYGSGLSSGQALGSTALRHAFGLGRLELATCFVSFGTIAKGRQVRCRPCADQILSDFIG